MTYRYSTLALALVLLTSPLAACMTSASADPDSVTPPPPPLTKDVRLYVANQEAATVSIIDVNTRRVIETVDLQALGFTANAKPHHVVVEPDGSFWYLSLIADGFVLKFDRDNHLVGRAPFETPGMMALHPGGELLYVGRSMAAVNPPQRIGEIHRPDMSIDELDVFFPRPHAIAVAPDGQTVYTGSLAGNDIASVDVASSEAELTSLPGDPHVFVQFAISPDGKYLISTGQLTGKLLVFDLADRLHPKLVHTVDVGTYPWHPAFSPDGRFVYFGNQESNSIMAVATDTWEVAHTVTGEGIAEPHGIAVSPDGRFLFVSNRNLKGTYHAHGDDPRAGTVVVVDTSTFEIVSVIEVGRYAAGMGIG